FESRPAAKLVTASCVQAWGRCDGVNVTVIDTADILHPGAATSEAYKEIARCVRLSSPGPHALLLVTPLGQFTEEDAEAAQRLQDIFGADVLRRTVVLLTHAEALAGRPLQEHLRRGGSEALQDLILQCGGRCCSFRNGAAGLGAEQQAARVMGMVCRVLREHGGTWHSSAMYLEPSLTEEKVREHMGRHRAERRRRERARAEPQRRIVACGILYPVALGSGVREQGTTAISSRLQASPSGFPVQCHFIVATLPEPQMPLRASKGLRRAESISEAPG
ncbi:GTPase IMAP family member 1-like, partial [Egretta garzetta]|uniref:GTPase IMAP family member 1-like n=1 Tax=Egretta garzetta TaxID=188379 RepID=UPI00051EF4A6